MVRVYIDYVTKDWTQRDVVVPNDVDSLTEFHDFVSELSNSQLGVPYEAEITTIEIAQDDFDDAIRERQREQAEEEEWEEL